MWAALAALLAWNIWLTWSLESLRSAQPHAEEGGEPEIIDTKIEGFTTDITETAAKAMSKVVSVSAVTGTSEHIESGVVYAVIGTDCWIITSARVINGDAEYVVRFDNGLSTPSELYGFDELTDIAVLLCKPEFDVSPMEIGASGILKQGEYAITLGGRNLHTQTGDVGFGVISRPGEAYKVSDDGDREWITQVILTDMPLTDHNCGGALINLAGQAIGILSNEFTESRSGTSTAVSMSEAALVADEIRTKGEVNRGYLGVISRNVSDLELYQKSAMNINLDVTSGVVAVEVVENSPAQEAGLQANDVITKVNDATLANADSLRRILYTHVPGDMLSLEVHRAGSVEIISVTLR